MLFSSANNMCTNRYHILGHNTSLNKLKMIEITHTHTHTHTFILLRSLWVYPNLLRTSIDSCSMAERKLQVSQNMDNLLWQTKN